MGRGRNRGMTKRQKKAVKAAKNQKKGGKMLNTFKKAIGINGSGTLPDSTAREYTTLNVALFSQKNLNTIRDIGLPVAGGSEYQVHYRGMQVIIESHDVEADPRRIVFTIPTIFFNFPQKVTSVAVNFDLPEVAAISEQCIPVSDALFAKYLDIFPLAKFTEQGWKVSVRENEMGSIHRHPSAFGFSGTDLDNKAENPGVIFRNLETKDKIQTDSVMYLPGPSQDVQLVTTETRIVDVTPVDDGIEGSYARASTLTYILKNSPQEITSFGDFFNQERAAPTLEVEFKVHKDIITDLYPEIESILKDFVIESEYDAQVIMDPANITQQFGGYAHGNHYRGGSYNAHHGYHKPTTVNVRAAKSFEDPEDWEDGFSGVPIMGKTVGLNDGLEQSIKPITVRPTWRKNQTINALRTKGIKVDTIVNITGDASDTDIIAIATEMKKEGFNDVLIRDLFKQMGYPDSALATYYTDVSEVIQDLEKSNDDVITAVVEPTP